MHRPQARRRHRRGAEPERAVRDRRVGGVGGRQPVVATLAGGPREFIWHDVNGFLVDPNPGGLAHGIGSLLADRKHCRALGANGRRAVEEMFHWDNIATLTEGFYHTTLH